jgi:hypothetical protein
VPYLSRGTAFFSRIPGGQRITLAGKRREKKEVEMAGTLKEFASLEEALQNKALIRDCDGIFAEGPEFSLSAFWTWDFGELFDTYITDSGVKQRKKITKDEVLEIIRKKTIKKIRISSPFSSKFLEEENKILKNVKGCKKLGLEQLINKKID